MTGRLSAVFVRQRLATAFGVTVLAAAGMMFAALLMPFATEGCIHCPLVTPKSTFTLPSFSLVQSLDGWAVLAIVVALGLASAATLVRVRLFAVATFVLAAAALAVCIFEGLDASGRVVGLDAAASPIELGGSGVAPTRLNPPASLGAGFYMFLIAAAVAVLASAAMVEVLRRAGRGSDGLVVVPAASA